MASKTFGIVGFDPGISGGVALICDDGIEVHAMPVSARVSSKKGNELNAHELARMIRGMSDRCDGDLTAYVESVHAMPKQGVTSMFNFGESFGTLKGVLAALGVAVEYVTPQAWKKATGLIGTDKDAARTKAIRLFPQVADSLSKKVDSGKADALLIAHYGREYA